MLRRDVLESREADRRVLVTSCFLFPSPNNNLQQLQFSFLQLFPFLYALSDIMVQLKALGLLCTLHLYAVP